MNVRLNVFQQGETLNNLVKKAWACITSRMAYYFLSINHFEYQKIIDPKVQSFIKLQYTKLAHKNQKCVRRNA